MSPPAVRRGSPPQQSFAATFQCRGPEVPLWDVGSSIRRLPPIGGCIVRSWQTRLRKLFKLANVQDGHAHRFRDTFAVELLLAGVPIERVSILLGHQSVRITEKHYAPWVRSRQEQLEADLANAWSRDPLVLLQSGVHQRYTQSGAPTTHLSSIRKTGARGGSRTHMRKNPRRILSPQRLPFRHPGTADKKK